MFGFPPHNVPAMICSSLGNPEHLFFVFLSRNLLFTFLQLYLCFLFVVARLSHIRAFGCRSPGLVCWDWVCFWLQASSRAAAGRDSRVSLYLLPPRLEGGWVARGRWGPTVGLFTAVGEL